MFKLISILLRGRAHDAEQAFADRNAVPLLAQQIRDAAQSIQSARRSVAVAIAQNEQERVQHTAIVTRIDDLENRASAALAKGNEGLAREAAEAIAYLEAERDASEKAQGQFTSSIDKLKAIVRASEARLQELQRGERLARATQEAQKLDVVVAGPGLATLDDAEETLARLRLRQSQNELTAAALKDMEGAIRPAGIIEKLANAGCGAPLRSSADDVLARLKSRITPAA
ncbi:PspA/IM30 family protein [Rhizobium leguminosarum]|uniref:PspA/IM30 family protein n=1 Tax=Rhizobium leguminosarum TaxID=384 RepID=A0A444HQT8_RHILE|nr:PspA/IM30 family protein [Rhizobium leguminosarum]MDH6659678.1 phage shock protein A [Rhizobium sophorae]ASS54071.1 PspA family regulator [Rhizobium leguminosarum bv. viciae]AVC48663.1 pspA/IM30 family protein [Rhizobium leguminosarum bv. viciae]MBB4333116.1 phage shock protein A [Rhizobium leguminosarum]MBB4358819.1 phage shock protein A [Rhizobium leguminosarum]